MTIEVGDYVRDRVTGFEGVVRTMTHWQYNCNRAVVQPTTLKDGYIPATETIDVPQLEVLEKGRVRLGIEAQKISFSFGDIVKDKLSPFQGIIDGFASHLNGCIRVSVQPQAMKDGHPVEGLWFPQDQLAIVQPTEKQEKRTPSGGPMRGLTEKSLPREKE